MSDTIQIEDLHEYIGRRGKCATSVSPTTRRRHDPWYDKNTVRGRYSRDEQRRRAQRACRGCPVQQECLLVALALEADAGACWGYWGGTIPSDRVEMLAARSDGKADLDDHENLAPAIAS